MRVERRITFRTAIALSALVAAIVISPAAAFGQSAAVDQYLPGNPPTGDENPTGGGNNNNNNPGGGGDENPGGGGGGGGDQEGVAGGDAPGPAFAPSAGTGETDAGSLPFTGYPLTGLLLIVLLLLVGGFLLRFGPTGIQRLRSAYGGR